MTARPEDMRTAMADYVAAVHAAYAGVATLHPPAVQGRMPLVGEPFSVVAAGAQNLHVVASADRLAAPRGQEVEETFDHEGMSWTLRFLDPVVLPSLGTIDERAEARPDDVRRVIGIGAHHYHLVVQPGSSLSAHHATHAGTALANSHLGLVRDYEALRQYAPRSLATIDELEATDIAGLTLAHGLLAASLAGSDDVRDAVTAKDRAAVRKALVAALRPPE